MLFVDLINYISFKKIRNNSFQQQDSEQQKTLY